MPTVLPPKEPEQPAAPDPIKIRTDTMAVLNAVRQGQNKIAGQLLGEMGPEEIKVAFIFVCGSFSRMVDVLAQWQPRDPDTDHKYTGDEIIQMIALESFK